MDDTADDYRMLTVDALRGAVAGDGDTRVLTLDRAFQGLPDTAHGGCVLAAFDHASGAAGRRRIDGHFLKRVPLGVPLRLRARRHSEGDELELDHAGIVLVHGRVTTEAVDDGGAAVTAPAESAMALPISQTCFACGTDNALGLRLRLRADDAAVGGTWTPRPGFRASDGTLAPVALTTALDEAAFWLGALATGEAGMTTELRVTLHAAASAEAPVTIAGARASTRPRAGDARYWDTALTARDAGGRLVASAAITFVAVRGTARRLAGGMLAINAPELLRRVFPAYVPFA
jgi:acyl-coenzyme A thioesterase PaaI-like protein